MKEGGKGIRERQGRKKEEEESSVSDCLQNGYLHNVLQKSHNKSSDPCPHSLQYDFGGPPIKRWRLYFYSWT